MAYISFPEYTGLVTLHRVRLNSGGYTKEGVHFGNGMPLYFVGANVDEFDGKYFRAYNRGDAIFRARTFFPNGRFIKVKNKIPHKKS